MPRLYQLCKLIVYYVCFCNFTVYLSIGTLSMHYELKKSVIKPSGFTLVELMITVVIIAILSAIALPSYQQYIKRANIKAAQTDLISLGLVFENYYQRNLSYPASDYSTTNALTGAFPLWSPSKIDNFNFSSTDVGSGTGYVLTATALDTSNLKGCVLTVNNTNQKTATIACNGINTW